MKRETAINILAKIRLNSLSLDEREDQIKTLMLENWNSDQAWQQLSNDLRSEFNGETLYEDSNSKRYDPPLLVWIKDELKITTNEFLQSQLGIEKIEGEIFKMESCPCCGRKTIEKRGDFEICIVCWWEDDGQDNKNADEIWNGPNYEVSLSQARFYFITIGIYNPKQNYLKEDQEQKEKYPLGRKFEILENGSLVEKEVEWKSSIKFKK